MKGVSSKHLQSSARTCQALEAPIPWVFETKKSSQLCGFRGWEGPPSSTHLTPPGAGSNESSPAQTRTSLLLPVIAEMPKMAFAAHLAESLRILPIGDWRRFAGPRLLILFRQKGIETNYFTLERFVICLRPALPFCLSNAYRQPPNHRTAYQ